MKEKQDRDSTRMCVWSLVGIMILLIILLFTSCGSIQYIPVENVKTEVQYKDRLRRDSIHVLDSVFVLVKGDTVFRDRYRTMYQDKLIRDTTYIYKTDSVHIPYPVEKELSRWQSIKMELGGWAFGIIIVFILVVFCLLKYK